MVSKIYVSRGTIGGVVIVSCETKSGQNGAKMQKNRVFLVDFEGKIGLKNNFSFYSHLNFDIENFGLSTLKILGGLFLKIYRKMCLVSRSSIYLCIQLEKNCRFFINSDLSSLKNIGFFIQN